MQIGKRTILRAGLGLAAVAAVLALVLMMGMFGSTEHTSAQEGETSGFTIPLSFYRLGEAGTVMNWSSEQVTDLLQGVEGVGGVNFIWITSGINFTWPKKGTFKDIDDPITKSNQIDGDVVAHSGEMEDVCGAARAEANPGEFPVILIQNFVDKRLPPTSKPMSGTNGVTLGGKGTWGTCILLSIGVKDNPATLAHELGHALCLVHQDNDSDVTVANLMWDTKDQRTGTELTLDQINRASECAPQLVGQPHDSDGSLSGASDIVVGSVNTGAGLFYCIAKTDHEASTNLIATWLQCNIDIEEGGVAPNPAVPPTWDDTCDSLAERDPPECVPGQLNNPSETGADALAGPPPPPPYTAHPPSRGLGAFYPAGTCPDATATGGEACTVVTTCFEDTGPIAGTGPNVIWTATILNPKGGVTIQADTDGDTVKDTQVDRVSTGTVDIWYNQNIANCAAGTPEGDPDFAGRPLQSIQVNDKGGSNINPEPGALAPGLEAWCHGD